jgi:hypothetical protein
MNFRIAIIAQFPLAVKTFQSCRFCKTLRASDKLFLHKITEKFNFNEKNKPIKK